MLQHVPHSELYAVLALFMRRKCAFCQRTDRKISGEHAWSNWIRRLFPPGKTRIAQHLHNRTPKEWEVTDDMGVKVNEVCEPCNQGWMNRLEKDVQPFLRPMINAPVTTFLSLDQQHRFARWAQKYSLVFDLLRPDHERYFTAAEREAFRNTLEVPGLPMFVWLACANRLTTIATGVDYIVTYDFEEEPTRGRVSAYCLTIAVGHVAFQVISIRRPVDILRPIPQRPGHWDASTLLVFPSKFEPLQWPPSMIFDDTTFPLFIDRWR